MVEVPVPPWRTPPKAAPVRVPITQDAIVTAALRILDAENLDAVSMRRVAQELDTGPASLYAHVANKQELLDLMYDRVVGEIPLPGAPDPARWQQQARDLLIDMHRGLSAHSDIARAALANIPSGPNALRVTEKLLQILLAGGVPAQAAAWFLDRISLYVSADAYEGTLWPAHLTGDPTEFVGSLQDYLRSLPAEQFPAVISHVEQLTAGGPGERFLFGLDLMLGGLAALITTDAARSGSGTPSS
jgi:AcrR family transcriptional regulator